VRLAWLYRKVVNSLGFELILPDIMSSIWGRLLLLLLVLYNIKYRCF